MGQQRWQFAVDVGGTFTDVIAQAPDGSVHVHKVLSSARIKGSIGAGSTRGAIVDPGRRGEPDGFWLGYRLVLAGRDGTSVKTTVTAFDGATGLLRLADVQPRDPDPDARYELISDEPSPILAVRRILGLRRDETIGGVDMRLGSTRATNALLERRGAHTAFVTTRGFGDILLIGNQDRPRLFDLNIRKPSPLTSTVIEIDERLDAAGAVLTAIDARQVEEALRTLGSAADWSLAICLLHAYRNPEHEHVIGRIACRLGFSDVSLSSQVCPLQRLVPRAETTVANAYLAPVIRDYVARIREALPGARLRLMTSNGGLIDADAVAAKDTILSGPAGGVVGSAAVATVADEPRCIGFDMGGTSTDVSRFDGRYEHKFETRKAGVRIAAPMLAIETVAAGGGSICGFDGQKLTVGPRSAGADPGPACYGNGGPLTVTDVNVFLDRVPADHFPFPLDPTAVWRRLEEIATRIAGEAGATMAPHELAEGFLRIANEKMAAAIRQVTVARGIDPRAYALVAFGGAGPQHACAVADLLGVERVHVSPLSGVLSAYGIGVADVRRIAEHAVHAPLNATTLADLEPKLNAIEADLRKALRAEGIDHARIRPATRLLDCRYVGTDAPLTVVAPDGDYAGAFTREHKQRYGYCHDDRTIEVVTARIECVGAVPPIAWTPAPGDTLESVDDQSGGFSVRHRRALADNTVVRGPAIILDDTCTIVVDPGWHARYQDGLLSLARRQPVAVAAVSSTEADPIHLELFNNRFAAVAEQMGLALRRTALSTNVKERLDYSCALFTAEGDLVVNAPHMPVHLGSMAHCVKAILADLQPAADVPAPGPAAAAGDRLNPGDVILTNDPYAGGTHLPDLTCVTPVFEGGRLRYFVASRAHHAEIGGVQPGSMPADATRLAEEGVVFRHFKLVRTGRLDVHGVTRRLTAGPYPSRCPGENIADLTAQIAANQAGANAIQALIREHGAGVTLAYTRHIQTAAARLMRQVLARMPDGTRRFEDALDDGTPLVVAIDKQGDSATIDFTGSGAVHPGNFNATPAIVTSAVLYCFRCLIDKDIPLNAGVLEPLTLVIPPGLLRPEPAQDPPAVAAGNVETSQRLVDTILGALGVVAASQGTMNNTIFGDTTFGYYETVAGGAGAGPNFDGADAVHTHMTNTCQTDPEILETRYPVRLRQLAVRRGSGGKGRFGGGDGIVREIEFLADLLLSLITQRRAHRPYGLQGGGAAAAGRNQLIRADGGGEELPSVCAVAVRAGDRLRIETPGGGGYGRPTALGR